MNEPMTSQSPFVSIQSLSKKFTLETGIFAAEGHYVWAVNDVSFDIRKGETYGLVGESGSGKTTLARMLVQLVKHTSGKIRYWKDGLTDPVEIKQEEPDILRAFRSEVKYVFQDPASSLDPRMNVFQILTAGAHYQPQLPKEKAQLTKIASEVMRSVGLREEDLQRRPSEFSGGQRQRISLARALLSRPSALICDEVVSALDVSIQGQILNLLIDLKKELNLTMLFIAHDLTVVSYMADRIGVLYGGMLMEEGPSEEIASKPLHPYTQLLYESIPKIGKPIPQRGLSVVKTLNLTRPPQGCPFAHRCPLVQPVCHKEIPPLKSITNSRRVACHFVP